MTTLHIEHPITDYPTWRCRVRPPRPARAQAGVLAERVARPVGEDGTVDERSIVVELDFASMAGAGGFRHFLETQVWASSANAPGLAGSPRTMLLEPVGPTSRPVVAPAS